MSLTKLITLSLLILLMFSSELPAIKTQSSSGLDMQDALVMAQIGDIILALHRLVESLLTTNESPANSPVSLFVEFDPQAEIQGKEFFILSEFYDFLAVLLASLWDYEHDLDRKTVLDPRLENTKSYAKLSRFWTD